MPEVPEGKKKPTYWENEMTISSPPPSECKKAQEWFKDNKEGENGKKMSSAAVWNVDGKFCWNKEFTDVHRHPNEWTAHMTGWCKVTSMSCFFCCSCCGCGCCVAVILAVFAAVVVVVAHAAVVAVVVLVAHAAVPADLLLLQEKL